MQNDSANKLQSREELIQSIFENCHQFFRNMHRPHFHHGQGFWGFAGRHGARHHNPNGFPFSDLNLSKKQIIFLFIVARSKEGVSVKDLAKFFDVSSGAVTQFIDNLIEKDLIKREEDLSDRRIQRIKLTDYAKTKFSNFKKGFVGSLNPAFDNLTDEELGQLNSLLNKLISSDTTQNHEQR